MKINKTKWNKKSNSKKFFLSSLAVLSLAATATISGLNMNGINGSSLLVNDSKTLKNDVTSVSSFAPPEANDLYDDYSYADGFITINGSVINFTDWFGFKQWSFDVNANLGNLFGDASSKVSTLKVRSSSDGTQIFVYGYLVNDSSYLFRLNTSDGSVSPIGDQNGFTTNRDGIIKDINLLTVVDGYLILTPKTPDVSTSSVLINFSQISLDDGLLSNINNCDITSTKSSSSISTYGEIIGVQKVSDNYLFEIKVLRSSTDSATNATLLTPSVLTVNIQSTKSIDVPDVSLPVGYFFVKSYIVDFYTPITSDSVDSDLDRAKFVVSNISTSSGMTVFVAAKYDTTWATSGYPDPNHSSNNAASYYQNVIAFNTLSATSATSSSSNINLTISGDSAAGITNIFYDSNTSTPYAVLADSNSQSKFAIASINMSNGTVNNASPGWIDLSTIGAQTSAYEIFDLGIIPNSSIADQSGGYYGYFEIQSQESLGSNAIDNETKNFVSFNLNSTSISLVNNLDFTLAISDSEISDKYKAGMYKANEYTKNQIVSDLIKVDQSGNPYNNVSYTENIAIGNQTLKGEVILTLNNWWNSGTTEITRHVDIDFATAAINVILYSVLAVAILVVIAIVLIIIKSVTSKKNKSHEE